MILSRKLQVLNNIVVLQLTRKGEMVFDLDSTHKKPYEPLIIGQFEIFTDENKSSGCFDLTKQCDDKSGNFSEKNTEKKNIDKLFSEFMIPENQIICSVPCSLHSRKPPLNGTKFQFFYFFTELIYSRHCNDFCVNLHSTRITLYLMSILDVVHIAVFI
jgi:hypothetical protein